jgi:hypothetical protein
MCETKEACTESNHQSKIPACGFKFTKLLTALPTWVRAFISSSVAFSTGPGQDA